MRHIVMILTLAGCGVESQDEAATWDAPAADQAESLRVAPVYGGCFDTTMYAANAGTTTAILFDLPGLVQATNNAGHRLRFTLPLPNPHVGIVYETGTHLTAGLCGGAAPSTRRASRSPTTSLAARSRSPRRPALAVRPPPASA